MILVVMEIVTSSGPSGAGASAGTSPEAQEGEVGTLMPYVITFATLSGIFFLCSFLSTYFVGFSNEVADEETPEDWRSPASARSFQGGLKRLGSFGTPRTAGKGPGLKEDNSEHIKGKRNSSTGHKKKDLDSRDHPSMGA